MHSAATLYRRFVVEQGLAREPLFQLLSERFALRDVLYPGCFVHLTPSFWLPHVVYVDRHATASQFFGDSEGVRRLIAEHKRFKHTASIEFVSQDFTQPLPFPSASFDLVLGLYAPDVSRSCARYLRPGGLLLTNNYNQDAEAALVDPQLVLAGVIQERGKRLAVDEHDLTGYLQQRPPAATRGRQFRGKPVYQRSASYYLFRRLT